MASESQSSTALGKEPSKLSSQCKGPRPGLSLARWRDKYGQGDLGA